jgi:hypothetical protein
MTSTPKLLTTTPTHYIEEDVAGRVVRIKVAGAFDRAMVVQHFVDNEACVRRWRAAGHPVRVLVDASELHPHTPDNQALVMASIERIYRLGDRIAIVSGSSLVKSQLRRTHTYGDIIGFFVSGSAAMTWLLAHD